MTHSRLLVVSAAALLAACATSVATKEPTFADPDMAGVWCSSRDNGKTCWAYGETYSDGTSDSCGLHPESGQRFAMTLRHEDEG